MSHSHLSTRFNRRRSGFSLIEVLIAVVVLSVGLLALGALQASLVRSAGESKARAGALSLAEDRLERIRAFDENYHSLPGGTVTENTAALGGTVSGVDYTRNTTVQRYVFERISSAFVAVPSTTDGSLPAMGAAGVAPQWSQGVEFKRVEVTVSWADAQGGTSTVRVTDSLSSVSPGNSALATAPPVGANRNPRVLVYNPESQPGVIPIAIGGGTDTAATNPRPVVSKSGNVVETRFEVLTYQGISGTDNALVQARVDTVVVGCDCQTSTAAVKGFRPTYWNGARYVRPEVAALNAPGAWDKPGGSAAPQSLLCETCCRDHHDENFTGPKFSPRRLPHTHDIVSGRYKESCRIIRVDGILHTAADMYNDYFNLLETAASAASPAPSTAASGRYENLVLRHLNDRMVNGTNYNELPSPEVVTDYETAFSINDPLSIDIKPSGDFKWLHSRGLYVDFLDPEAVAAINFAKTLSTCQGSAAEGCVLRRVPFTSINLTELSRWAPITGTELRVTNADFAGSAATGNPVRGRAETISATAGTTKTATATILDSNAGVALLGTPINGEVNLTDGQEFRIVAAGTDPPPGPGEAGTFGISVEGWPFADSADVVGFGFVPPGAGNLCGPLSPGDYDCASTRLGGPLTLLANNYNFQDLQTVASLTCTNNGGNNPVVCPGLSMPVCRNFRVDSASVGAVPGTVGIVSNEGKRTETTTLSFALVSDADQLRVVFSEQAPTLPGCLYSGTQTNACTTAAPLGNPCD